MEVSFFLHIDPVKWCRSIEIEGVEPISTNWESIRMKQSKIFPLGSIFIGNSN